MDGGIVSEIIEYYRKCSSVKLGLGGVTSVRRNHQKYKTLTRMEQPRVNWDRGQYDVTLVTLWRQTLRNSIQSAWSASQLYCGKSPSLFRFTKLCSSLQFNNNCLCYFTDWIFQHKMLTHITFPCAISGCVWHESSITCLLVSVIVGVPIVIFNSAVLFELIGTLRYTTASCYYGYFGREGLGWQLRFLRKPQTD